MSENTRCPHGTFYSIAKGETLPNIASRFDLTMQALLLANPGLNPNRYVAGQVIVIPEKSENTPSASNIYEVGPRESLGDVLRRLDISIAQLREYNPDLDIFSLQPGDQLNIPSQISLSNKCRLLVEGESLTSLARTLGVDTLALLRANPHLRPRDFCAGQIVRLP